PCKTAFDLSAHWQTFTGVYSRTTSLKMSTTLNLTVCDLHYEAKSKSIHQVSISGISSGITAARNASSKNRLNVGYFPLTNRIT
ncbi:TPA: hypothetical protein ACWV5Q_005335, partial [Salmonella enterica subsp. enterica serovar Muenchen]